MSTTATEILEHVQNKRPFDPWTSSEFLRCRFSWTKCHGQKSYFLSKHHQWWWNNKIRPCPKLSIWTNLDIQWFICPKSIQCPNCPKTFMDKINRHWQKKYLIWQNPFKICQKLEKNGEKENISTNNENQLNGSNTLTTINHDLKCIN